MNYKILATVTTKCVVFADVMPRNMVRNLPVFRKNLLLLFVMKMEAAGFSKHP